jgi:hypothetical protein
VAHAQDLRDGLHGQAVPVSRADFLVTLLTQRFGPLLKGVLALSVVLGKGGQMASGLWCLAFSPCDPLIV